MRYWFDPQMKWKTFKMLNEKFGRDAGPTPQHGDQILFRMLRERKINLYLDTRHASDPIILTLKSIPKKATILTNYNLR